MIEKKRIPIVLTAVLLLSIILSGCQVGGSASFDPGISVEDNNAKYDGPPVTGDWVVRNLLAEPESLNPYTSTSASATNIYRGYIYESFLQTRREPPWDDVPLLAESMPEMSDDHLTYKWKLREDIYFHDGEHMTISDVVFSLKALMNPYVDDLPSKPYYAELDSLRRHGEYGLTMYCMQPYFMHLDFFGSFIIIPKHVFDPEALMDDLTYFQVVRGSTFGHIADYLNDHPDIEWQDLIPALIVESVKRSIESSTNGEIKWDEIEGHVDAISEVEKKLNQIQEFLMNHQSGEGGLELIKNTRKITTDVLNTLPLTAELRVSTTANSFPKRTELEETCRDIHDRIEKFGRAFNKHDQNRAPTVGSGPYKFENWVTGQEIVLARNTNYWGGAGKAFLDKLVWRVLTDYTASLVALKNGEVDFMGRLQTIQYLTMTNQKRFLDNFVKSAYTIPQYTYLGWRTLHPIFSDPMVRRAMTHMVRRKDAVEKLQFGYAEIVTSNFYRYGMDYDSTIVPYEYDPDEAMRLLSEAGWADIDDDGILEKDTLEFKFEMLVPSGSSFAEQLVSILREDLFMIGIEMDIRRLEWSVFINNYIRNHNFDACYLGWVFGLKGDPKQVWHSESAHGRGSNHVQYMNPKLDSLIDAARIEFDAEKRIAMYHEFQQILHEEQPYTFLFSSKRLPAYDQRFKGVKWYPFRPGYKLDEWFVPKDEQKYQ